MTLDVATILDGVTSHASALGLFDRVGLHEPKNAPGNGMTFAAWVDRIEPVRSSGLASTSIRLTTMARLYMRADQEPADAIDPDMVNATSVLLAAYSGDFDLGTSVRCVDLLGQAGVPMSAQAGYVAMDGAEFRVMTITIPILCNDVWDQSA